MHERTTLDEVLRTGLSYSLSHRVLFNAEWVTHFSCDSSNDGKLMVDANIRTIPHFGTTATPLILFDDIQTEHGGRLIITSP